MDMNMIMVMIMDMFMDMPMVLIISGSPWQESQAGQTLEEGVAALIVQQLRPVEASKTV